MARSCPRSLERLAELCFDLQILRRGRGLSPALLSSMASAFSRCSFHIAGHGR